jgi:hypothetical protein
MAWVLEQETATAGAARLVLLALANHANDAGEAYPGIDTICVEANISRRTCEGAIRELISKGLITRDVNAAPDERIRADKRPNLYRLTGWQKSPARKKTAPRKFPQRGGKSARNGVARITGQTINEPSENLATRFSAKPPITELKSKVRPPRAEKTA